MSVAAMTRALQRAAEDWVWIETGQRPVEEPIRRADRGPDEALPYSATFRVETWGASGRTTYTVVVTESSDR